MTDQDPFLLTRSFRSRFHRFQDLMPNRVHDILLVSSVYDSFILEEDGRLDEGLINEYMTMNLVHLPRMIRIASGEKALELLREGRGFDLVICTMRLGDMDAPAFARAARAAGHEMPIVLLSYDNRELKQVVKRYGNDLFSKLFLWQGDFRLLLAIVKCIEDRMNVGPDTRDVGVQSIIVIEDNVRYYSAFLPLMYSELMRHSQDVLTEGINLSHRVMRMRARPKLLFCESYEEAWQYLEAFHDDILGVISDIEFPRGGEIDETAGIEFARNVRAVHPDVPILLQSSNVSCADYADALGISFVEKGSQRLLGEVRTFMVEHLSFGDFVFRDLAGREVARACDLHSLEKCIAVVPEESLLYHAEGNHFSNWLKARTEFRLAHQLRPRKLSDYESLEAVRQDLVRRLREFRLRSRRGIVVDFDATLFDSAGSFARIGAGSLGGKGRGLAFTAMLLEAYGIEELFEGVRIGVPATVVLGTDVFDEFMSENGLADFALSQEDQAELDDRFLAADLPGAARAQLRSFLSLATYPLAVRSSSLLEDSRNQSFAGIYRTVMAPNLGDDPDARLEELQDAIKLVYASTYSRAAKAYMRATSHRQEEEKMAVVIQRLVGKRHGERFYPDVAGVARSYNFYPVEPVRAEDGIASVALGLGAMVVEGGQAVRFCPRYPRHLVQFSSVEDTLAYSQRQFYALDLSGRRDCERRERFALCRFDLDVAERDGTLALVASTYSPENDAIHEGISRDGVRLVSLAPILSGGSLPLAEILRFLLRAGRWSMSASVEIEFAANTAVGPGESAEFSVLQMRPMVMEESLEEVNALEVPRERLFCESEQVLGHGVVTGLEHVLFVMLDRFQRSATREVAQEIAQFNYELSTAGTPYVLVGVGRWGSADPWLGIPVAWEDISGARIIVETSFEDLKVVPSQGSHFFQNLTTMRIGYFTVDLEEGGPAGYLDWDWLAGLPSLREREYMRLVHLEGGLSVRMDGRSSRGVIIKPNSDD